MDVVNSTPATFPAAGGCGVEFTTRAGRSHQRAETTQPGKAQPPPRSSTARLAPNVQRFPAGVLSPVDMPQLFGVTTTRFITRQTDCTWLTIEHVAGSAHSADSIRAELAAQVSDVDLDQIGRLPLAPHLRREPVL